MSRLQNLLELMIGMNQFMNNYCLLPKVELCKMNIQKVHYLWEGLHECMAESWVNIPGHCKLDKCKSMSIEMNSNTHHAASSAKHNAHLQPAPSTSPNLPAKAISNKHCRWQFYWIWTWPIWTHLTPGVWTQWLLFCAASITPWKPARPWGLETPVQSSSWHPRGPRAHRWVSTIWGNLS